MAIGAAAGVISVWTREQADKHPSNLAGEEARARTAAARLDSELPGEKIVSMFERAVGTTRDRDAYPAASTVVTDARRSDAIMIGRFLDASSATETLTAAL